MKWIKPLLNELSPKIPLMTSKAKAGFPSPAEDYTEEALNLHDQMVVHPASTFFVKVSGDSMQGAGILEGDMLVIDRSLEASHGKVIMAILNGEFTVKYFHKTSEGVTLVSAHPKYPKTPIRPEDEFEVWGVVTHAIHHLL